MSTLKTIMKITGATLVATNLVTAVAQFAVTANSQYGMNRPGKDADHYITASENPSIPVMLVEAVTLTPGALAGQALGAIINKRAYPNGPVG